MGGGARKIFAAAGLCLTLLVLRSDSYATTTVNCSRLQETLIASKASVTNNSSGTCTYVTVSAGTGSFSHALVQFAIPNLGSREIVTSVTLGLGTLQTLPGTDPFTTCNAAGRPVGIPANYSVAPLTNTWTAGSGCGAAGTWLDGSACAGAGWNNRNCGVPWGSAGGDVGATVGPVLSTVGKVAGNFISAGQSCQSVANTWCSVVQAWADAGSGPGWRFVTGSAVAQCAIQYFAKNATMSFDYVCKAGFQETGSDCTSCTTTNSNNCVTGASGNSCNDLGGTTLPAYNCSCGNAAYTTGTVGGGLPGCVNKDECVGNPCDNNGDAAATCADIAAPGTGHNCTCGTGFHLSGPNGTSSVTCIGNCTTGAGGTQHTASDPCVGTPPNVNNNFCTPTGAGTWSCTCVSGWATTGGNTPACQDINECSAGGGNASCRTAVVGGGNTCSDATAPSLSWTCGCGAAYTGTGTTACTDRNDCAGSPNPCASNGDATATCVDVAAPARGRTCGCTAGFILSGTNGTLTATCVSGCTTGAGGTQKTASDPCAGSPANVPNNFCTPGAAGVWTCTCASGWASTGGNNPTCQDINECTAGAAPGTGNASCKTTVAGSGNQCNDATAPSLSWSCNCGPAYDGDNTTSCTDHNACAPTDPCRSGGDVGTAERCTDAMAPATGFSCTCDTGYTFTGGTCQNACHPGNNPCAGNGDAASTCAAIGAGGYSCTCTSGYVSSGGLLPICNEIDACTISAAQACATPGGNSCVDEAPPSTTYHCNCSNLAYVANAGNTACLDRNECVPNHCRANGNTAAVCSDHVAPQRGYDCTCSSTSLWTETVVGGFLTCIDTNECLGGNPCHTGGTCTNVAAGGGYSCTCDPGFVVVDGATPSPSCEHPISCNTKADIACVSTQPGNHCVDLPPPKIDYTCACDNPAFAASPDGHSCADKNDCRVDHCGDGGDPRAVCVDHRAPRTGYECQCSAGWAFDGATCADVNECAANPCGRGTCNNTPGGYQCNCPGGYQLVDGTCKQGGINSSAITYTVSAGDCSAAPGSAWSPTAAFLIWGLIVWMIRRRRR